MGQARATCWAEAVQYTYNDFDDYSATVMQARPLPCLTTDHPHHSSVLALTPLLHFPFAIFTV